LAGVSGVHLLRTGSATLILLKLIGKYASSIFLLNIFTSCIPSNNTKREKFL
jgi:hypothetical protein